MFLYERYISVNFSQVSYSWSLFSNLLATSIFLLKTLGHLYFYHVESEILNVKQPIDLQETSGELKPENGTAEDEATESQHEHEAPKESQHESDGIKENDTEPRHENEVPEADVKEPEEAVDESVAVNEKAESDKHSETEEENESDGDSESDSDEYTTGESGSSESHSDGSESEGEVSESQLRTCHGNFAQNTYNRGQNSWDTNLMKHFPNPSPCRSVDIVHSSLFQHDQHCLGESRNGLLQQHFQAFIRSRIQVSLAKCVFVRQPYFLKCPKMF